MAEEERPEEKRSRLSLSRAWLFVIAEAVVAAIVLGAVIFIPPISPHRFRRFQR
ncbi:MAG: hypothetical protein ACE5JQ_08245 [Candidatus Methylomirabilales bacterium]